MKLAICTPSYWPEICGISTVSSELSNRLSSRGFEVTVFTERRYGWPSEEVRGRVNIKRFNSCGKGHLLSWYRGEIAEYQYALINYDADINLLIGWENSLTDTAVPIFSRLGGLNIIASHGTSVFWRPKSILGVLRECLWLSHRQRLQKNILKMDHIVLLTGLKEKTRFFDRILIHKYGLDNWSIIPNGTDMHKSESDGVKFRDEHRIGSSLVILYVSNFHWAKNQRALIDMFIKARLKDAWLVLIGSSRTPYGDKIEKYIRKEHRNSNVLFLAGPDPRLVRSAYNAANIYACSSLTEAQPLTLLDAMAIGIPFVSFKVGCVSELQGDITVDTKAEFILALRRLAENDQLRKDLGQRGISAAEKNYRWENSVKQYAQLFNRLVIERQNC